MVPSLLMALVKDEIPQENYKSVKVVIFGGAPISSKNIRLIADKMQGATLYQIYGMTELTFISHMIDVSENIYSVGKLLPHYKCKVFQ